MVLTSSFQLYLSSLVVPRRLVDCTDRRGLGPSEIVEDLEAKLMYMSVVLVWLMVTRMVVIHIWTLLWGLYRAMKTGELFSSLKKKKKKKWKSSTYFHSTGVFMWVSMIRMRTHKGPFFVICTSEELEGGDGCSDAYRLMMHAEEVSYTWNETSL